MRFKCFLLLTGLGLLIGPAATVAPLRGQSGGGGLRVERVERVEHVTKARPSESLKDRWDQLTGGAAVWKRADVTDPLHQLAFDLVAERVQSTNGEITKEQFLAMSRPADGKRKDDAARPAPVEAESPKVVERKSPTAAAPLLASAADGKDEGGSVAGAEAEFRRRDANHDGLLDHDEMDEGLRAERDRWDANGDGFIDLAEFRAYFRARTRMERAAAKTRPAPAGGGKKAQLVKGPYAIDLPANLPPWFREYDRDGDGQIGLYEWKAAGQPITRFLALDLNGDGFLTPDEVMLPAPETPKQDTKVSQAQNQNNDEIRAERALRAFKMHMLSSDGGQIILINGK
jgi:hypothetical protein